MVKELQQIIFWLADVQVLETLSIKKNTSATEHLLPYQELCSHEPLIFMINSVFQYAFLSLACICMLTEG